MGLSWVAGITCNYKPHWRTNILPVTLSLMFLRSGSMLLGLVQKANWALQVDRSKKETAKNGLDLHGGGSYRTI